MFLAWSPSHHLLFLRCSSSLDCVVFVSKGEGVPCPCCGSVDQLSIKAGRPRDEVFVALEELDTDQPRHQPQAVALVATEMRRGILVAGVWRDLPSQQGRTRVSTEGRVEAWPLAVQPRLGGRNCARRDRRVSRQEGRPASAVRLSRPRVAPRDPSAAACRRVAVVSRKEGAGACRSRFPPRHAAPSRGLVVAPHHRTLVGSRPRRLGVCPLGHDMHAASSGNEVVAGLRGWGDKSRIKLGKTFALTSATRRCGARVSKVRCS